MEINYKEKVKNKNKLIKELNSLYKKISKFYKEKEIPDLSDKLTLSNISKAIYLFESITENLFSKNFKSNNYNINNEHVIYEFTRNLVDDLYEILNNAKLPKQQKETIVKDYLKALENLSCDVYFKRKN